MRIFVSLPPMVEWVERVGGERVRAESLLVPGQNPHTFQPSPRQIERLADARVFFMIGVPFEDAWHNRIAAAAPQARLVSLGEGLPLLAEPPHGHDGDAPDAHAHGRTDPHVWMDPMLVARMTEVIARTLAEVDPPGRETYEQGARRYRDQLQAADQRIRSMLASLPRRAFLIDHPSLGYFARAYGLTQLAIEVEGKHPTARELAATIDRARAAGVRVVFVDAQSNPRSAEAVAEALGGEVRVVDPLARNYLENLERVARAIAHAGGGPGDEPVPNSPLPRGR